MRVLFVDDEPNVLSGLRRILRGQRNEWDMTFAEGGQPALDVMGESPCDVIVSDMKMPGMDGAELLSKIQAKYPATIRIALSGETDNHMIYRCVQHAHQYLAKPCDADALVSAVQRAFRLRALVHDDKLEAIVADMTALPSMPEQYEQIMQEIQSDDPSLQKIGEIIETDVAMAAKILQLVNSAFFGLARHLSSPAEAAMYLGVDVLKSLVLTTGVFSQFDDDTLDASTIKRIWDHSTEVGALAKAIASSESDQSLIADYSLMGGLMTDIGKLVFATNFPDK
ncbi:MAG: HDOD domain-containing protein, partial [Woeseiaceae bacterium]